MRRILLALALVALVTSAASANTWVWWELAGSNNGATATQGKGLQLAITPGAQPAGDWTFDLVMKVSTDATVATKGLTGYATNLWRGADTTLTATNIQNLDPMGWGSTYVYHQVPGADQLLNNEGRARSQSSQSGVGGTPVTMISLTIDVPAGVYDAGKGLIQSVGASLFAFVPLTGNSVMFGSNPLVAGATAPATMPGTTPVIAFGAFTPEPATLALLGLGFLGLIRRR